MNFRKCKKWAAVFLASSVILNMGSMTAVSASDASQEGTAVVLAAGKEGADTTEMPIPESGQSSIWAFSGNKAACLLGSSITYNDTVQFKVYEAETGGTEIPDKCEKIGNYGFYIKDVTEKKTYYVSATEEGKSESSRGAFTVLPKDSTERSAAYVFTNQELTDYLNFFEADAAELVDGSVVLSKEVTAMERVELHGEEQINLDLNMHTLFINVSSTSSACVVDCAGFQLRNGVLKTEMPTVLTVLSGNTYLEEMTVQGVIAGIYTAGNFSMKDTDVKVVKSTQGLETDMSMAFAVTGGTTSIISGSIQNELAGDSQYTYMGMVKLESCIAPGSTTEQTSVDIGGDSGIYICNDDISVTATPDFQEKVDEVFGPGNVIYEAPDRMIISKDIELEKPVLINPELIGEQDIILDLNGKHITVKPGTDSGGDALYIEENMKVVITGGGSMTGGSSMDKNGSGGNVINGKGTITVEAGTVITGGAGKGTGTGGAGIVVESGGELTVNGSVIGGAGGNGATDGTGNAGNGGNGVIAAGIIHGNGTITGGNGGIIAIGGSGSHGKGGAAISGGGSFPDGTTIDGKTMTESQGKVEIKPDTPAVAVSEEELVKGVVTEADKQDTSIQKIDAVLTVEKKLKPADKDKVEKALAKGQKVGVYLDIVLEKMLTRDSGTTIEQISKAASLITITVEIPKDIRDGSGYKIIRVHDGKAAVLPSQYDAEKYTLTFQTDKFSTYAIAYTPKDSSGDTDNKGDETKPDGGKDDQGSQEEDSKNEGSQGDDSKNDGSKGDDSKNNGSQNQTDNKKQGAADGTDKETVKAVHTGDYMDWIWFFFLTASGSILAVAAKYRKKQNRR